MTPSLVVAVNSGTIASRTTKSDMRMPMSPVIPSQRRQVGRLAWAPALLFARFLAGRPCDFACRRVPAMVLDFLFVPTQLPLQLVHHKIDGSVNVCVALVGDDTLFVFRRDDEFDHFLLLVFQIDGHLDHGEPSKVVEQLFCLVSNELLGRLA